MTRRDIDGERRKLFRRMEWVLVYAPPLVAVFIALFGGIVLALFVPVPGTNFWGRWAIAIGILLVLPVLVYLLRALLRRYGFFPEEES